MGIVHALATIGGQPIIISSCYCSPDPNSTNGLSKLLLNIQKAWRFCQNSGIKEVGESSVSSGGGCIIYIKDSLNPVVIDWFRVTDSIAVEFDSNIGRVNIACIYR